MDKDIKLAIVDGTGFIVFLFASFGIATLNEMLYFGCLLVLGIICFISHKIRKDKIIKK